MKRLTTSELKIVRDQQVVQQRGKCAICQQPITSRPGQDPVLDHCHKSGAVRATLHRSCNSLLGKVENNGARFGVPAAIMPAFLHGAATYLQTHTTNITGMLHSTHLTEDEKRIKRNKQAVKRRATARKPV